MATIVLVIDVILAIMLVILVLMQRSDGALGSLGGGASSMMSTRARGNFLTRTTWIVAISFMLCSLMLAIINKPVTNTKTVILEDGAIAQVPMPAASDAKANTNTTAPAASDGAAAPVAKRTSAKSASRPVSVPISAE